MLQQLLHDMFHQRLEYLTGRIVTFPSLWRWAGDVPPEVQQRLDAGEAQVILRGSLGKWLGHYRKTAAGRIAEMTSDQAVICPNIDLWSDTYPYFKEDRHLGQWVARSACRRCEFYRSAKQGGRQYPTCAWAASQRTPAGSTAEQAAVGGVVSVVEGSVKQVEAWAR